MLFSFLVHAHACTAHHFAEYEARRQVEVLESGGEVEMETRWFDPVKKVTTTGRRKEDKIDYR